MVKRLASAVLQVVTNAVQQFLAARCSTPFVLAPVHDS